MNHLFGTEIKIENSPSSVGFTWHPSEPKLVIVSAGQSDWKLVIRILKIEAERHVEETKFKLNAQGQEILSTCHHYKRDRILVVYQKAALILDLSKQEIVASFSRKGAFADGGFYPDEERVWLLSEQPESSDWIGKYWGTWNYVTNTYQESELESFGSYCRGAVLHPSGLLLAACWSDETYGYLIHKITNERNELFYYKSPAIEEAGREAYMPVFSTAGDRLAFIVNSYMTSKDTGIVRIFDISNATPITEFPTHSCLCEIGLQFCESDSIIAFCSKSSLYLYDTSSGELVQKISVTSDIECFNAHKIWALYAISTGTNIVLVKRNYIQLAKTASDIYVESKRFAEKFIADNEGYLTEVGR